MMYRFATTLLNMITGFTIRPWSMIPTRGKVAAVPWAQYQNARPDYQQLMDWFKTNKFQSAAVITGEVSQLLIIDFDSETAYQNFSKSLRHLTGTMTVKTRRGYHLYFTVPAGVEGIHSQKAPQIDVLYNGRYAILPGSTVNGFTYQTISRNYVKTLDASNLQEIQQFLARLRDQAGTAAQTPDHVDASPQYEVPQVTPSDLQTFYGHLVAGQGRNNTLFQLACLGRDSGLSQDQVEQALAHLHAIQIRPYDRNEPYEHRLREAQRTIASAFGRPPRQRKMWINPQQLPNQLREGLIQRGFASVVQLYEALGHVGYRAGRTITRRQALRLLREKIGRDTIYRALGAISTDGVRLFPPCIPPVSSDTAKPSGKATLNKCLLRGAKKAGIIQKRGRRESVFIIPTTDEIAAWLGIQYRNISDPLPLKALKSPKTLREAMHEAYIRRKPGQHPMRGLARRLGVTVRTIQNYNRDNERIQSEPIYLNTAVNWHNVEDVIPDQLPHPGFFLTDTYGKRYPACKAIARYLLARKQTVTLKRQRPNYWWHTETGKPHQSMLFQADLDAIQAQMQAQIQHTKRRTFQRGTVPAWRSMPERATTNAAMGQGATSTPIRAGNGQIMPSMSYNPVDDPADVEHFARSVMQQINAISQDDPDHRLTFKSAQRIVERYSIQKVKQALKIVLSRRNVEKPVGLLATILRSESKTYHF